MIESFQCCDITISNNTTMTTNNKTAIKMNSKMLAVVIAGVVRISDFVDDGDPWPRGG